MITVFPLLALSAIAYNVVAFWSPGAIDGRVFYVTLPSGGLWNMSLGTVIVGSSLVLLFFEVLKSTRSGRAAVLDHMLSMGVFVGCLIEFMLVPQAGTDTFFLIVLMTFLDVVSGFTVSLATARRDIDFGGASAQ